MVAVILCVGAVYCWLRLLADRRLEAPTVVVRSGFPSADSNTGFKEGFAVRDETTTEPFSGPPATGSLDVDPGNVSLQLLQPGKLFWEQQIETLERASQFGDAQKGRQILALLPSLPEEALEAATESAVRLLRDAEYPAARDLLLNPRSHGRVLSVLFADLLARRDEVVLPALMAIAKTPGHPLEKAARDNLEFLLGQNFGGNWEEWERAAERSILEKRMGPP